MTTSERGAAFVPDESQRRVIRAEEGYHLVLAPPGCGKTQILTERIRRAHEQGGVAYGDMLCLTFTNRAARGMQERIGQNIADSDVAQVYVGNVHRFCSKFLFENSILPAETSIIDDEDAVSILARHLDEDELQVMENATRRREYFGMIQLSHLIHQIAHGHDRDLRMHPDVLTADDLAALKTIGQVQRLELSAAMVADVYAHTDFYLEASRMGGYDMGQQVAIDRLLTRMATARAYEQYKRDNRLVDFEDLLIMTYDVLRAAPPTKTYRWIQVDEVQDLNPLQLAIVDLITARSVIRDSRPTPPGGFTVMYLGDEQQAIFSFMGAKLSTLDLLRRRCQGHIHHLSTNHRSPDYLLRVFNEYASVVLRLDSALLPKAAHTVGSPGGDGEGLLRILRSNTLDTEYYDVAHVARQLAEAHPDETTAIIVNANQDADRVSEELAQLQTPHFKVSGEDVFSTHELKLLWAHLNVLANEHNFIAWARLLRGLKVCASNAYARNLVQSLVDRAMLPSDLMAADGMTYVERFAHACWQGDIVVFDTETTGLDVAADDIVQIAAVRMRQGRVVEGSAFNVFLETSRPIPERLGDLPNPLIEELRHHRQLPAAEGLRLFLDYVGNDVLLGHNVLFDWQMLRNNVGRAGGSLSDHTLFDSLKLIRLMEPNLRNYKLKSLLAVLGLAGENSHLADDDVRATCSLVAYCQEKAREVVPRQQAFLAQRRVRERAEVLRRHYQDLYEQGRQRLYEPWDTASQQPLVGELLRAYDHLRTAGLMEAVPKLHYVADYLSADLLATDGSRMLAQQLAAHMVELNTLKEADLAGSRSMTERVYVSTVHKAKGLEFDNVIVFDAVEDRYPNYFNRNNPTGIAEDARKFYVALTRARRRLYVAQCLTRVDWHNQQRQRVLTRFMTPLLKFFS